ncbi:MAG: MFS transporter [Candidatus Altiarchaeales archaeon]|nr:MFS transporter [Candidatus Altiarchaeales archaeon]
MPEDKKLSRNVLLLGVGSFLTDLSSEMIFPILPLFLVNILHADVSVVGLIDGIAESTADLGKMVSGWLSDKMRKRKPFIIGGYSLSSVTKPFFALAGSWPHVLIVRFIERIGKGVRGTARDAMVADETTHENRGKAFGYRKMMDQLGAVLGPLVVFLLMPYLTAHMNPSDAYRAIFWIAFIPAILAVITVYFVKEKVQAIVVEKKTTLSMALGPRFKKFLGITLVFAFGMFTYSFLILRAQEIGVDINIIPLLYLCYNLSFLLFAMPVGMSADKIGRKKTLAIGYLIFAFICFGLMKSETTTQMWLMFILYGAFMAIIETVQRAYISDIVNPEVRGTALGLHQGAAGFAALPANLIVGFLWSKYNSATAFTYSILVSLIAVILLAGMIRERKKS